jgi:hypothetical protein
LSEFGSRLSFATAVIFHVGVPVGDLITEVVQYLVLENKPPRGELGLYVDHAYVFSISVKSKWHGLSGTWIWVEINVQLSNAGYPGR